MDFPIDFTHKPVIGCIGPESLGWIDTTLTGASGSWPTANRAYFIPFTIRSPYRVRRMWWCNGSGGPSGNADAGVYTPSGRRLFSTGATARGASNILQSVALGTPYLLEPGLYYMGLSTSSAVGSYFRFAPGLIFEQMIGMAQVSSAHPLPATVTFGSVSDSFIPFMGIASASVI